MGSASPVVSLLPLFVLILFFVLGYFIIRLAVRHGIDSSETARHIKNIEQNRGKDDED